jgi:hypothetical protein
LRSPLPNRRAALLLGLAAAFPALLPLPALSGPAILHISGKVTPATGLEMDLEALDALPQHDFTTNTPWTKEPHSYRGPLLRDVLARVKAQGTTIKAVALNDYQISIPVDDAGKHDVILATRIDGKPIPVRGRGPIFVIYPFDSKPELKGKTYFERAIWQLKSLRIE